MMGSQERLELREQVRRMFYHGYDHYKAHGFPKDELRPLSCTGFDTWGGYSLTLVDALDTLVVMGNVSEFHWAVDWICKHISFDRDVDVSVFETNIRVLGGFLSAHLLISDPSLPFFNPAYQNELLHLATDLADRMLPAFDTPTGIPYGTVNLMYGVPRNESKLTCTAGGGTFILEFGLLSLLSGDARYEHFAKRAIRGIHSRRNINTGLVGNHIDITTGKWTHRDAGIGAGIDSYYEYLFKAWMLFRDEELLQIFNDSYQSIMQHVYRRPWYVEVNMDSSQMAWPILNSLQAFWPGIQGLYGEILPAVETLRSMHSVWRRFGGLPEGYNLQVNQPQPGQKGYPLRPELIESTYHLYRVTRDPSFLHMGKDFVQSINTIARTECGYATIKDVDTHELYDRMESFFLAETCKYLYLLFDEHNFVHSRLAHEITCPSWSCTVSELTYTFNTEGHLFPLRPEFAFFNNKIDFDLISPNNNSSNNTQRRCRRDQRGYFSPSGIGVSELVLPYTNVNS